MYGSRCNEALEVWKQDLSQTRGWIAEKDDKPVGLTKDCERVVYRLIEGGPTKLDFIAIWGSGGTGKTTLVNKVYNDVSVKAYFESRGWALMSKKYRLRNLLLSILSNVMVITKNIYDMEESELKRQLSNQLRDRRYLIVIDDVWNTEYWDELKYVFPKNKHRSRIMITTRHEEIALSPVIASKKTSIWSLGRERNKPISESGNYSCFQPGYLSIREAWEIFCKKIFGEEKCPRELESVGRKIVSRCGKLPLLVVLVACILKANEKTFLKWDGLARRLSHPELREPLDILTACYPDIPQHLKMCFLYLGVFPEDFEISVKQLIQLWIAEGMIQWVKSTNNFSMEDVAEDYLEQLISLNLIQVIKRRSNGGAKSCCIHDFIRDLCIKLVEKEKKEKKENLPGVLTGKFFNSCNWQEHVSNLDTSKDSYRHVSSISWFSEDTESFSEENWKLFFKQFPSLKVLNFGEGEVGKLPEAITNKLFHLKYLRMKSTKNMRVPKSIFNLQNLQTIDLRTTKFPELPKGIWKMQQLRHLYLDGPSRLPKVESEDYLPNLQTLCYIKTDFDDDIHISEKAPNLRKLGLYGYQCLSKSEQVTFNLPHLQSLKFAEECTFEEPIELPDSITKITVKGVHLQQNVIKIFEKLPNLQILKLVQTSFDDANLVFGENSFPRLQLLKFEDSKIVTWRLEKGAISNLHRLVVSKCPQLTEPPIGLQKLNELQELELSWASMTFAKKLYDDLNKNEGLKLEIYPPLSSTSSS